MPWFNVDDGFANSKPVLRIPRRYRCASIGLWTLAGSWSAKELTDGFIPDHALDEFCSTKAMATLLVQAGLWKKVPKGWQFQNWSKYQKTKEQVYAYRAAEAERKRLARSKPKPPGSGGVSGVDTGRTDCGVPLGLQAESGLPVPIPKPLPKGEGSRPHCPKHPNENSDGPCIPCKKRREWDEANALDELDVKRLEREAIRAARDACLICDENGMRGGHLGLKRCTHEAEAAAK